jgi:hypothetical protein
MTWTGLETGNSDGKDMVLEWRYDQKYGTNMVLEWRYGRKLRWKYGTRMEVWVEIAVAY